MRRTIVRSALALALVAPACGEPTAPPEPGELTVRLATPNTGDAAAVLTITLPSGATPPEILPSSNDLTIFHRVNGSTVRVAIFGALTDGAIARFAVPDVRDVGRYTVHLVEVADESNALREQLTGYSVSVIR